jgi:hypothetical protein
MRVLDARVVREGCMIEGDAHQCVKCGEKKFSRWYLRDFELYTIV